MNATEPNFIHPEFKLNGIHQNQNTLLHLAESFIKEGDEFEIEIANFIFEWFGNVSFIEINTSGTTGNQKKIKIHKKAMANSALATGSFFNLSPNDKALHCLPMKYIAGKMMFVRGMVLGLDLDIVKPSLNPLQETKSIYDFAAMVPLQVQNALNNLYQIKKLIIGGAKINNELKNKILELPLDAFETYGMTETITHIAIRKIGEELFTLLPDVTIATDSNNCLLINAPRISEEIIKTNDVVKIINERQFEFIGRYDNIINSGGIKLYPEQIEDKLSKKIKNRFFVTAKQDEVLGEKLILVIEGEKQTLDTHIFEGLNKYEKPKEILFIRKFKETENGKIIRNQTLFDSNR